MRLVVTLLVASAAVGYSQTGARLLGPRPSVVTPGISGTEARAAVPSKPGVEINAWVQVNDAHCPVPLAKAVALVEK